MMPTAIQSVTSFSNTQQVHQRSLNRNNVSNTSVPNQHAYARQCSEPTPISLATNNLQFQPSSQQTTISSETHNLPFQTFSQPTSVSSTTYNVPSQQTRQYATPRHVYMNSNVSTHTNVYQQPTMTTSVYDYRNYVPTSNVSSMYDEQRNIPPNNLFNATYSTASQQPMNENFRHINPVLQNEQLHSNMNQRNYNVSHANCSPQSCLNNLRQRHVVFSTNQNQHICNDVNSYSNIPDVVTLLPFFDPSSEKSLGARQFIQRVELLKSSYQWSDQVVIFAVQQKMQGAAKYWVDSFQEVFTSWPDFVQKFVNDFPDVLNEADVHVSR